MKAVVANATPALKVTVVLVRPKPSSVVPLEINPVTVPPC